MPEHFHFIRPLWLLLIPLGLLISIALWRRASNMSNWHQVADRHLLHHLLVGKQLPSTRLPFVALALAWILVSVALAGPAWERLPQPVYGSLQGRVIVFDLSKSMDSPDLKPSRLVRARFKLNDLIQAGRGLQQGLVVFAGDAFTVAPLTDDAETLINLVPSLSTETVPVQGSRPDLGLSSAARLLSAAGIERGDIILITDGLSPQTLAMAESISADGHRISVMAVGTSEGAPIPASGGGLLKDHDGNIVIAKLDIDELRRIALAGNGHFTVVTADSSDISILADTTGGPIGMHRQLDSGEGTLLAADQWVDNGPWLLLPLLLIAAAAFRRGWILSLMLLYLPLAPDTVHAFEWEDLWQRPDQRAADHYIAGDFEQIQRASPGWLGAARYRLGDFEGASQAYESAQQMTAKDHYNRGNALARSQSLEQALKAYDQALEVAPNMDDALFNRELVKKLLDQQQSESESQQSGQPGEQNPDQTESRQNQRSENQSAHSDSSQQDSNQENTPQGDDNPETNSAPDQQTADQQQSEPQPAAESKTGQAENQPPGQQSDNNDDSSQVPLDENQLALEQWLKRIPDDPGGLLRRKFAWQYRQRDQQSQRQNW